MLLSFPILNYCYVRAWTDKVFVYLWAPPAPLGPKAWDSSTVVMGPILSERGETKFRKATKYLEATFEHPYFFLHRPLHIFSYGTLALNPFLTKLMSLIYYFWQLIVTNCDYAERCGWFLSARNADASHAVYLVPDDSWYSDLALSFGIRSTALTVEE